jgi:hypothetical protein
MYIDILSFGGACPVYLHPLLHVSPERWAVKEATYKAFSVYRLPFPDILLKTSGAPRPQLHFTGVVAKWAKDLNVQVPPSPPPPPLFPPYISCAACAVFSTPFIATAILYIYVGSHCLNLTRW